MTPTQKPTLSPEQQERLDVILGDFLIDNSGEENVIISIDAIGNAKRKIASEISLALAAREEELREYIDTNVFLASGTMEDYNLGFNDCREKILSLLRSKNTICQNPECDGGGVEIFQGGHVHKNTTRESRCKVEGHAWADEGPCQSCGMPRPKNTTECCAECSTPASGAPDETQKECLKPDCRYCHANTTGEERGIDFTKDNIYDAVGRPDLKPKGTIKCEWVPCGEDAKYLEPSGDGRLLNVCAPHRRLLRKQKALDNPTAEK